MESETSTPMSTSSGVESIYIRIKKDIHAMPETDKAKLTDWAKGKGFTVSNRKRILHAE